MHILPRRTGALVAGLIAAAALAIPLAGQADAATTRVQIVQKAKPNAGNTEEIALSVNKNTFHVGAKVRSSPGNPFQTWIKQQENGQFATYESVILPGMCLEVPTFLSGEPLMVGPCSPSSARQRWTQGFSGDSFRKLQNQHSLNVATFAPSQPDNITGNVRQFADAGSNTQKWSVRPV
jgi:hypothetical protein